MPGDSFGHSFRITTAGESHGPGYVVVIDGCPPGLPLAEADLAEDLARRRPGQSRIVTPRDEPDVPEILSGVFEGKTTGVPIALLVKNTDQRSRDYEAIKDVFRPGHADYTYLRKYGVRDYRGSGRASARETAMRVAAGAVARKYLTEIEGIVVQGYLERMGSVHVEKVDWEEIDRNLFFCPDAGKIDALEALIDKTRRAGDSIGAQVRVVARGVPPGRRWSLGKSRRCFCTPRSPPSSGCPWPA